MSRAAPREGRDHDTSLPGAGAVALTVVLAALAAQLPTQEATAQSAPCTTIEDDAERLACYDRAQRAPAAEAIAAPRAPASEAPAAQAPTPSPAQSLPAQSDPASVSAPAASPAATPPQSQGDADKETVPIVIVGVRTLPGRETTFTAQDGATWVQTDSQRVVGLPETPFDAELRPGVMGSQFLVPKNGARAIRVRRAGR